MYHFSSRNLSREATKAIKHINPQVHRERHGSDITPQQKRKTVWKRSSPILQAPSPPSLFFFLPPSLLSLYITAADDFQHSPTHSPRVSCLHLMSRRKAGSQLFSPLILPVAAHCTFSSPHHPETRV